jgi:hypothetical protein
MERMASSGVVVESARRNMSGSDAIVCYRVANHQHVGDCVKFVGQSPCLLRSRGLWALTFGARARVSCCAACHLRKPRLSLYKHGLLRLTYRATGHAESPGSTAVMIVLSRMGFAEVRLKSSIRFSTSGGSSCSEDTRYPVAWTSLPSRHAGPRKRVQKLRVGRGTNRAPAAREAA